MELYRCSLVTSYRMKLSRRADCSMSSQAHNRNCYESWSLQRSYRLWLEIVRNALRYQRCLGISMTKTKRQPGSQLEAFHKHFSSASHWKERWQESLYPALTQSTRYAALSNRFSTFNIEVLGDGKDLQQVNLPGDDASKDLTCFIHKIDGESSNEHTFPPPSIASNGLHSHWNLDIASLVAVRMLQVQASDRVLDLCAAPGGKSIGIAQSLDLITNGSRASLHVNEFDRSRHKRLHDNLRQYLPASSLATGQVQCLNLDGMKGAQVLPLGVGGYDKVLLDAPCSSERHIIHAQDRISKSAPTKTADELSRWSPSYAKRMAETQVKLLLTALRAVKAGGRVLYATCSISKEENDDVVEKALRMIANEKKKVLLVLSSNVRADISASGLYRQLTTTTPRRLKLAAPAVLIETGADHARARAIEIPQPAVDANIMTSHLKNYRQHIRPMKLRQSLRSFDFILPTSCSTSMLARVLVVLPLTMYRRYHTNIILPSACQTSILTKIDFWLSLRT
ncbi:hypothetical protein MRB53_037256 [Persea americana]|nr:hypothetical protein MRB53_037256 [Persea americana]